MYDVVSKSANSFCVSSFKMLEKEGSLTVTDKGDCLTLKHFCAKLTNPKNRYVFLNGRTNSVYATIGEIFWVLSSSGKIKPWLTKFLKRAEIYSDDGEYWTCAYGPRLYEHDQLNGVIQYLIDKPNTRQAVLSLYDPAKESYYSMLTKFGTTELKDKTCNLTLLFSLEDKQLELTVMNRSNDAIFGLASINLPEFTFIQELVAEVLNARQPTYLNEEDGSLEKPTPITAGDYIVFSNNYHSYRASNQKQGGNETAQKQFEAVLENYKDGYQDKLPDCELKMSLGKLVTHTQQHEFGLKLRTFFTKLIEILSKDQIGREDISEYLNSYNIRKGSTIWAYSMALYGYLFGQPISEEDLGCDEHFIHVLKSSKFTKFEILPEEMMFEVK